MNTGKGVAGMFELFRKKRIERYTQEAEEYVCSTYAPLPHQNDPNIRYSLRKPDREIKYSDRDTVQYSLRGGDTIPKQGDRFLPESVDKLFSKFGMNSTSLEEQLGNTLNLTFVDMLSRYINLKGWRDSKVYKAAQIDRRLFSKIMSDREYKPSKDTALALAIALELSLQQTNDLLDRAGYTLSHSNKRDVIIEYFIREGIHRLSDINEVLYKLNQKTIGR